MCTVSGWGNTMSSSIDRYERLQSLRIPILSDRDCIHSYPDVNTTNESLVNINSMFCAGYLEGGKVLVVSKSYEEFIINAML